MANKKQSISPTFKAGLILIILMFIIWGVLSTQEPWYNKSEQVTETKPTEPIKTVTEETLPVIIEETPDPTTEESLASENETTNETTEGPVIPPVGIDDSFDYTMDPNSFVNDPISWSYRRNSDHTQVEGYTMGVDFNFYDAFYLVNTDDKVLYLTFDEGYENGYTSQILDTLNTYSVQAAFFVTESYIRHEPELVKRMKDEGHIVANHSVHHYDGSTGEGLGMPDITNEEVVEELKGVEVTMEELTGYPLDLFFRPPGGLFSERTLYITRQLGYKTIFWSMSHVDWYVNEQPTVEETVERVMTNYHPGAILLLHAVSEANTNALGEIIESLQNEGYRFGTLYEIPSAYQ